MSAGSNQKRVLSYRRWFARRQRTRPRARLTAVRHCPVAYPAMTAIACTGGYGSDRTWNKKHVPTIVGQSVCFSVNCSSISSLVEREVCPMPADAPKCDPHCRSFPHIRLPTSGLPAEKPHNGSRLRCLCTGLVHASAEENRHSRCRVRCRQSHSRLLQCSQGFECADGVFIRPIRTVRSAPVRLRGHVSDVATLTQPESAVRTHAE